MHRQAWRKRMKMRTNPLKMALKNRRWIWARGCCALHRGSR